MRVRSLVFLCVLFLALPLVAADKKSASGGVSVAGQQIEVLSWSFGASQPATSTGGGGGTGKVQFQDFHFTSNVSKSSSELFLACAEGRHFPTAVFTAKNDKGQPYLEVKLTDVLISSYSTSGSGGDVPTEQVSLNYAKIEYRILIGL